MGIRDRQYMRDEPSESEGSIGFFVLRALTVMLAIYLTFFCARAPLPLLFKIPLLAGLFFFLRYLWRLPAKMSRDGFQELARLAKKDGNHMKSAYNYERALEVDPDNVVVAIRLLSAYDASGQINKAGKLIRALVGAVIPERHVEEFEHLVADYDLVTLEKTRSGHLVKMKE